MGNLCIYLPSNNKIYCIYYQYLYARRWECLSKNKGILKYTKHNINSIFQLSNYSIYCIYIIKVPDTIYIIQICGVYTNLYKTYCFCAICEKIAIYIYTELNLHFCNSSQNVMEFLVFNFAILYKAQDEVCKLFFVFYTYSDNNEGLRFLLLL